MWRKYLEFFPPAFLSRLGGSWDFHTPNNPKDNFLASLLGDPQTVLMHVINLNSMVCLFVWVLFSIFLSSSSNVDYRETGISRSVETRKTN